jgi:hypothetical protein
MTVTEDGETNQAVPQSRRAGDAPGGVLASHLARRAAARMSIVGPRPHAVAGITGWAKMKARIDYDLDYLRNWSRPAGP